MNCPFCDRALDHARIDCPSCGKPVGYPNVRLAETAEEKEALDSRYATALASAMKSGSAVAIEKFDAAVQKSAAVITISVDILKTLATDANALFTNYHLA